MAANVYAGGSSTFNESTGQGLLTGNKSTTGSTNPWQSWVNSYNTGIQQSLLKNPFQYRLENGQLQKLGGGGDAGFTWENYTPGNTDRVDVGNGLMMGKGSAVNGKWQTGGYHTQENLGGGNYRMTSYDDQGNVLDSWVNNPATTRASGGFMGKYGETLALGTLAAMGGAAMMGPGATGAGATSGGSAVGAAGSGMANGVLGTLGGTAGASAGTSLGGLTGTLSGLGAAATTLGGLTGTGSSLGGLGSLADIIKAGGGWGNVLSTLAGMYSQNKAQGQYGDLLNQAAPYRQALADSYANPEGWLTGAEGQALADVVSNKVGRSDAAGGRNANSIGREKELQDAMMLGLNNYRQGLQGSISSIYGGLGPQSNLVGNIQGSSPLNNLFYNNSLWDAFGNYLGNNAGGWYDEAVAGLGNLFGGS